LELADGGTAFIDEIHHLGDKAQGMLLRFLEDRKVRRVGGKTVREVDVRIIFAGKPVFEDMVQEGKFLSDLAFRMKQVVIQMPLLKERDNDVEVLAYHFLDRVNELTKLNQKIHPDSIGLLKRHSWPGNVRELKTIIECVCSLVQEPVLLPEHFLKAANLKIIDDRDAFVAGMVTIPAMKESQKSQMISLILQTYQACDFNITETARILAIPRSTLRELCKSLGIAEVMNVDSSRQNKQDKSQIKEAFERYVKLIFAVRKVEV
jgi:DNA-binding NtrC family response regulator